MREVRNLRAAFIWGRDVPAEEFGEYVDDCAGEGDGCCEEQRIESEDVFIACGPEREGNEERGADAEGDGSGRAAGDAEGAMQIGLAKAQDNERDKLQE